MLFLFSSLPSEAADARQLQEQRLHEALLRLAAGETDAMSVLYENSKPLYSRWRFPFSRTARTQRISCMTHLYSFTAWQTAMTGADALSPGF